MAEPDDISARAGPKPGRPRDPEVDRAILQATLKLLTDRGYAGMSIEGVASAAGVGKTAIYRRFPSKAELAAAAIGSLRESWGPLPDTGSARSDIVEMLTKVQATLAHGLGFAIFGALLVEERRNPELLRVVP